MTTLGQRLKQTREAKQWTQLILSHASGINVMAVSHFECGRRLPSLPNAVRLCEALDCSLDWLARGIPSLTPRRK
jgi:transcriptional regulator with XRE-family HTH domain